MEGFPLPQAEKWNPCRRGDFFSPSHAEFPAKAAQLTAIIEETNRSLCEKDEVLLQKEQELDQLEKGEGLTPDQRGVASKPAVTGSHCAPATLGHSSALLQMHQLQNELEALRSCRAQEAVPATTGQDPLQLQGQESLVSAVLSGTGGRVECLLCTSKVLPLW